MGNPLRPTAAGVYHLAVRSSTPDFLFKDGADRLGVIGQIERITLDTDWTCIGACLMGTHYHLLVDAGESILATAMKRINWACAVNHNRRHGRRGHWVGGKYMCIPVESEEHLLGCYRYIARNPVKEGPCARPADWPWSSYATTIGESNLFPFVDASLVFDTLDSDPDTAIQRLRGLVDAPLSAYGDELPVAFRSAAREEVSDTSNWRSLGHLGKRTVSDLQGNGASSGRARRPAA